ncbi:MAG: hypothetical protein QOI27_3235 [Gaiellaceae bacterium]|nr:hypothetical protein [Gaiellaceae bacterium]MDX6474276.1 hypothetical protein [Gaiellaceae bacterium]
MGGMTKATQPRPETILIRVPGSAEITWRTQRLVSLGADADLAAEIADSDADVHDIERLLKAGCPLDVAWSIVRPVHEASRVHEASSVHATGAGDLEAPDPPG